MFYCVALPPQQFWRLSLWYCGHGAVHHGLICQAIVENVPHHPFHLSATDAAFWHPAPASSCLFLLFDPLLLHDRLFLVDCHIPLFSLAAVRGLDLDGIIFKLFWTPNDVKHLCTYSLKPLLRDYQIPFDCCFP